MTYKENQLGHNIDYVNPGLGLDLPGCTFPASSYKLGPFLISVRTRDCVLSDSNSQVVFLYRHYVAGHTTENLVDISK